MKLRDKLRDLDVGDIFVYRGNCNNSVDLVTSIDRKRGKITVIARFDQETETEEHTPYTYVNWELFKVKK